MRHTWRKLFMAAALTGLMASPALAVEDTDNEAGVKDAQDEWNIPASEHWRNDIDADDERVLGYVATVDYPTFTLRTHDAGVLSFVIPETTQYADDLRTGQRIQVWYDTDDFMTDEAGEQWMIIHGYGIHDADRNMAADNRSEAAEVRSMESKQSKAAENRSDVADSVRSTGLPPGAKAGPGPMAYSLTGTITAVNDESIVLDTVVGPRVVRLVEGTDNRAELEKGNDVTIEFHKGGTFIHAKVIHEAGSTDTR